MTWISDKLDKLKGTAPQKETAETATDTSLILEQAGTIEKAQELIDEIQEALSAVEIGFEALDARLETLHDQAKLKLSKEDNDAFSKELGIINHETQELRREEKKLIALRNQLLDRLTALEAEAGIPPFVQTFQVRSEEQFRIDQQREKNG